MKLKCIGCGLEYEGGDGDLCPRDVGNGMTCACLYDKLAMDKPTRSGRKTTVEMTEGANDGGN